MVGFGEADEMQGLEAELKIRNHQVELQKVKIRNIQAELAKFRWIPVGERLPEQNGEYLVLPYIEHSATLWWQNGWYWYDEVDDAISDTIGHYADKPIPTITHWKPRSLTG